MLAFKREAVALVVLVFYFLVFDEQTQESRLQQLLLLQHLKRSRQKRLILLQIALRKARCVRRAFSWPRNQFWFETLLNRNFVEEWWKENLRISRRTFTFRVGRIYNDLCFCFLPQRLRRPKPNVETWSKTWSRKCDRNPDTTGCEILRDRKRMYLSSKPWLPTLTMPAHRVNRTFTLVNFLLSWAVFTIMVSVGVHTRKIFT